MSADRSLIRRLAVVLRRPSWRGFILLLGVAGVVGGVAIFAAIADEISEGGLKAIETHVMQSVRRSDDPGMLAGPSWLPEVARDVTALGSYAILTLVTLLVLGYLLLQRMHHAAALVLVATIGGSALSHTLKWFFQRARPDFVPHLVTVESLSFPSGHSMLSSVVYLTLGSLLARTASRRRAKIYLVVAALLLAFVTGVSRVILGVHYPSDVLAGWAAGISWALLCWIVAYWLQRRGAVERDDTGEPGLRDGADRRL